MQDQLNLDEKNLQFHINIELCCFYGINSSNHKNHERE